jgi:hypothetical protein
VLRGRRDELRPLCVWPAAFGRSWKASPHSFPSASALTPFITVTLPTQAIVTADRSGVGSETAAGILYDAVDASAADAEGVAIVRLAAVRRAARSSMPAFCSRSTGARSARSTSRMRARRTSSPVGVPGLFRQYNAPADFVETANTIGLPRYAKQAVDQQFARWVMLHVQSNPLPICTRPRVLIKRKRT